MDIVLSNGTEGISGKRPVKKFLYTIEILGCGLKNCVGSRPFPQKPRHTIRATYVMDCSALKLGQKNINTVGRDDLPCFGAEAVLSFSANDVGLRRSKQEGSFKSWPIFWVSQNVHICLAAVTVASPGYRYWRSRYPTQFLRSGLDLSRLDP